MNRLIYLLFFFLNAHLVQSQDITLDFIIDNTPLPVIKFGYEHSCFNPLRKPVGLIATLEDFDFDAKCEVVGFNVKRVRSNEREKVCKIKGSFFDECYDKLMVDVQSGDEFVFYDILVMCPGYEKPVKARGTLKERIR